MTGPRIAVERADGRDWLADAVREGGGVVADPADADALVWGDPGGADALRSVLDANPHLRWVQLPWAGVEPFVDVLDHDRRWTCGKGVYADPVAEHALALALAGMRGIGHYLRRPDDTGPRGRNLLDANVTVLGGGGITEALLGLLEGFRTTTTVVRRRPDPLPGADRMLTPDRLHDALATADLVVLALALTPETDGIIDAEALEAMPDHAWLVNVARGAHVVTDDLVAALEAATIGGAALDVTDPEPLPTDHPLRRFPDCLVTPHTANTPAMAEPLLSARVRRNVERFAAGEPLLGPVDPDAGY